MAGRLTNRSVVCARHPGFGTRPVRVADGEGLFLQIAAGGGKSWLYRFTLGGKAREMGLGSFLGLSLAQARLARDDARAVQKRGDDPILGRANNRLAIVVAATRARSHTFESIAEEMIGAKEAGWRSAKHRQQWRNSLATYAYPEIGSMPVSEVGTDAVLRVLKPIWNVIPETASRVRGRIERVLAYAKSRDLRTGDNPAVWRNHLSESLPSPRTIKGAEPSHHPALDWRKVGQFYTCLQRLKGLGAVALQLAILSACRTNEVIAARWSEVNLNEATWTIPAVRMKSKREHRVPLSPIALEVLLSVKPLASSTRSFIFPGAATDRHLSEMSLLMTIRRMNKVASGEPTPWLDERLNRSITPHGFRSSFRDWVGETTAWTTDLAEAALAHVISDKTVAAYARGDLFGKRRELMAAWADYCIGSSPERKVL